MNLMPITNRPTISVANRVSHFSYAIRNIVDEAKNVEARGLRVRYMNVGDPVAYGFQSPPHLIEAVERALRDGYNGYAPSAGVIQARDAVAADYTKRGVVVTADRVLITTGTSEGIELVLTSLVDEGDEVLVPVPTYPLYTAVIAKLGAGAKYYRTDPNQDWMPDLDHLRSLITPRTRVLVVVDPNNPTGAVYPTHIRRALIDIAEEHGLVIVADEVYGEVAYDGPVPLLGTLDNNAPIISLSSLSKAYLAPGWRTGWMVVGSNARLDNVLVAMKRLADARLCSPGPMQYAVVAALQGDQSHLDEFRSALTERARLTTECLSAIPAMSCVPPRAAFYAMPSLALPPGRTDEDFVLSLLRETGILCVYGSGFGMAPEAGCFRVVFLASPEELTMTYNDIAAFTEHYLEKA